MSATTRNFFLMLLLWHLLVLAGCISAMRANYPRLGFARHSKMRSLDGLSDFDSSSFQMYNYTQTLDHFNYKPESYTTFQQRYVMNSKYWGGANISSPIFVYTGDEAGLEADVMFSGFLTDNAVHFKALLVYIEHRYYGTSVPFGSAEEAYRNSSTLGYFSSAQALADYAELITYLKKNLSAESCPVIAIGGSYGGMLASWFRLKYPHIVYGALASSAPILYFDDITPQNGYYSVVTKDFRDASESCYNTIKESWGEIDELAVLSNGLTVLSQRFNTCHPLNNSQELKDYLEGMYVVSAQYDYPPKYPVNMICNGIDGAPIGTDVLGRILAGVISRYGQQECLHVSESEESSQIEFGWTWQECSEMVFPIGRGSNDTMFQAAPFDLKNYTKDCQNYGVTPRPHWITTEFGGHNIKSVIERFGSNIIFSNGLKDPYSIGGVLQNISDSVLALYTTQGAHCMDLYPTKPDDPTWVLLQRKTEVEIVERWLTQYNTSCTSNGVEQT